MLGESFSGEMRLAGSDSALFVQVRMNTLSLGVARIDLDSPAQVQGCDGVPNSTGMPSVLTASGSDEVQQNRFHLSMTDLPANSLYLPIVSSTAGFTASPGGSDGTLCLGGAIGRLHASSGFATAWGEGAASVDLTQLNQPTSSVAVQAGETWHFQAWYRDISGAGGNNFTSSIAITFR